MPPFLVMPGSLRERYFCLSLIEPCNIVKIVVVFSDRKATSITHTHSDARFAFKSFDVNSGFNIGIRFVAKYSLVFQIQLIKIQQILLGASITVCKKKDYQNLFDLFDDSKRERLPLRKNNAESIT